jgi:hypothetical protein
MTSIFFASIPFILWTITIILIYYSTFYSNINHIESSTGYAWYLITIGILYLGYKIWTVKSWKKHLHFWILGLIGLILLNLFILSVIYTGFPEVKQSPFIGSWANGMVLFFHVVGLLLYPVILILITRNSGMSLAHFIVPKWKDIDMRIRVPAEITLWFLLFSLILVWVGWAGYYNLTWLIFTLLLLIWLGFNSYKDTYHDLRKKFFTVDNHNLEGTTEEKINLNLLSIEFWFLFFSFLLWISLISIIRPMPIGWDDLWVYMNFPKIMATTGELLKNGWLYAWQLITGTGFLFNYNASQAFYVNQIGWILAVSFLASILSYAFEGKGMKSLISLPILLAVFYYAMPMTIFQQAKDMKLDPAYFAFSISSIWLLLYSWKHSEDKKVLLSIIAVIGLIVGFSFTVKVTSLMIILWVIWILAYYNLSLLGYFGYFFIFLSIFSSFNLWSFLNVPMPKDQGLLTFLGASLGLIGWIFLIASIKKHGFEKFQTLVTQSIVFLISVLLACSPWFVKNIYEVYTWEWKKLSITTVITWAPEVNRYDYTRIFSDKEIEERLIRQSQSMTSEWQSQNEDMWRYFWYETWLNNYLKLPANLTFQKNQWGEFTDITYLFLALVPSLILFIPGRKKYAFFIGWLTLMLFMALYYFTKWVGWSLTSFFGQFTLVPESGNIKSYAYALLIIMNLWIVWFFHHFTKDDHIWRRIRDIIIFMGIYAFLFVVSAFGIVWYGILMYFGFFLIIWFSAYSFTHYSEEEQLDQDVIGYKLTLSAVLFIFIATYFVRSSFPHAWNNLKSAYYNEYKYNTLTQEESIFLYRSDYLLPIATMNLKNPNLAYKGITDNLASKEMKNFFASTNIDEVPIDSLHMFLAKYRNTNVGALKKDIEKIGQTVYRNVLYPTKETANTKWIYRIGTFMTYLINKNSTRYFDDSLLMAFRDFFYDPSPEATIERMKKMDLGYLLVDLNAATIDKDPRHNLTDRFEKLLLTMTAKNLRLVSTDNFCIELAINEKRKWKITTDDAFLDLAGTNYESYRWNRVTARGQKLAQCQLYIIKLINEWRAEEYPLITQIANELYAQEATENMQKIQQIMAKYVGQSWFALFEILDAPVLDTPKQTNTTSTWASNPVK